MYNVYCPLDHSHVLCGQNLASTFRGQQKHVSMHIEKWNTTAFEVLLWRSSVKSYQWKTIWLFKVTDLTSSVNLWSKTLAKHRFLMTMRYPGDACWPLFVFASSRRSLIGILPSPGAVWDTLTRQRCGGPSTPAGFSGVSTSDSTSRPCGSPRNSTGIDERCFHLFGIHDLTARNLSSREIVLEVKLWLPYWEITFCVQDVTNTSEVVKENNIRWNKA